MPFSARASAREPKQTAGSCPVSNRLPNGGFEVPVFQSESSPMPVAGPLLPSPELGNLKFPAVSDTEHNTLRPRELSSRLRTVCVTLWSRSPGPWRSALSWPLLFWRQHGGRPNLNVQTRSRLSGGPSLTNARGVRGKSVRQSNLRRRAKVPLVVSSN